MKPGTMIVPKNLIVHLWPQLNHDGNVLEGPITSLDRTQQGPVAIVVRYVNRHGPDNIVLVLVNGVLWWSSIYQWKKT